MKTKSYNVYDFNELSDESKECTIEKWYEHEDYPFLSDDLEESCHELLKENNIDVLDLKLYYSLSSCQGDGLCFIGNFEWKGCSIKITHLGHYYYAASAIIKMYNKDGENVEDIEEVNSIEDMYYSTCIDSFKTIYYDICKKLEKEGYSILEYRMDNEEFSEFCSSNEYQFLEDGTMD